MDQKTIKVMERVAGAGAFISAFTPLVIARGQGQQVIFLSTIGLVGLMYAFKPTGKPIVLAGLVFLLVLGLANAAPYL